MKVWQKILLAVVLLSVVGAIAWGVSEFYGNPVCAAIAKASAERHLQEAYPGESFTLGDAIYNFKFDEYSVMAQSTVSADTRFRVYADKLGRFTSDSRAEYVENGRNTYDRFNDAYAARVDEVLTAPAFPWEVSVINASLPMSDEHANGVDMATLPLDAEADYAPIAARCGHLYLFLHSDEVTAEEAARILLKARELLDAAQVPFADLDLILCRPFTDEEAKADKNRVQVYDFPYEAITADGLADRVAAAQSKE